MYYQLPNPSTRWQRQVDNRAVQHCSHGRWRLAVHESSHGLGYRFFRIPVRYIWVDSDIRGECLADHGDRVVPPWPQLVSVLAGEAADWNFFERPRDEQSTRKEVRAVARDYVGLDRLGLQRWLSRSQVMDLHLLADQVERAGWMAALRLTRYFQKRITRLADALDRAGRLDGNDIDQILGELPKIDLPEPPQRPNFYDNNSKDSPYRTIITGSLHQDDEGAEMRGRTR